MGEKMPTIKCLKCGWEWVPRVDKPKACTRCKSYDYMVPRQRKRIKVGALPR